MIREEWRPIPGVSASYEVSDLGRVRSHKRAATQGIRILSTPLDSSGRPSVCVDRHARRVHNLVTLAFLGPRPDGQETRHLDGDKTNNVLSNLAYGTPKQNMEDSRRLGLLRSMQVTHCPRGHEYDEENTYQRRTKTYTFRKCRECNRRWCREYKARRRARLAAAA